MARLDEIIRVAVPRKIVEATLEALQEFGEAHCEGLALWVGRLEGSVAKVTHFVVPRQRAMKSEDGVGYFVESEALFAFNVSLSERKLRLIAQVHSHPKEAYHSETDDRYAIVTAEGGFSLVVPNFGHAPSEISSWAVYRLSATGWDEISASKVARLFEVEA